MAPLLSFQKLSQVFCITKKTNGILIQGNYRQVSFLFTLETLRGSARHNNIVKHFCSIKVEMNRRGAVSASFQAIANYKLQLFVPPFLPIVIKYSYQSLFLSSVFRSWIISMNSSR
jgi:hypothetical protein